MNHLCSMFNLSKVGMFVPDSSLFNVEQKTPQFKLGGAHLLDENASVCSGYTPKVDQSLRSLLFSQIKLVYPQVDISMPKKEDLSHIEALYNGQPVPRTASGVLWGTQSDK